MIPCFFCRWNIENFNYKRPAANNGGIANVNDLADIIEEHGGTRIKGSNNVFAFTNISDLMECSKEMLDAVPWVRHVNTVGFTAAQRNAVGRLSRPICDEVILVSQAPPASGAVVATEFAKFFM